MSTWAPFSLQVPRKRAPCQILSPGLEITSPSVDNDLGPEKYFVRVTIHFISFKLYFPDTEFPSNRLNPFSDIMICI